MKVLQLFKQIPMPQRRKAVDAFLASLSDVERKAWQRWFPNESVEHIHLLRQLRGKPFCLVKGGLYYRRPVVSPYYRGPHRPNGGGRAA